LSCCVSHTILGKIFTVKKILFFTSLLMLVLEGASQSIDCNNICVTNISMNTEGGLLDITIINGSTMINYPIVTVIVDGDTVGNIGQQFYLFAHIASQEVVHTIPTTLASVPAGFTCTVTIQDSSTGEICVLEYPCLPNLVDNPDNLTLELFPNPVQDLLSIRADIGMVQAVVADVTGSVVMNTSDSRISTLNIAHLPSGIYFLKLIAEDGTCLSEPFIKN
jgi:hypothetical protein